MSTAPSLPPDYRGPGDRAPQQPPPPRHPRRWVRIVSWIVGIFALLILTVAIGIVILLHSERFHRYVLNVVQQKASAALGSNITVRDFKLTFSGLSPTLDVYNVTVAGAPPYPTPPLLQIDHARVGVRVVSVLSRTWYLNDVVVNHPVVHVFVDKNGNDNLPKPKKSQGQSNTNLFQLGVRHAVLDRGEIYVNDRKSAMEADLHDLDLRSTFNQPQQRFSGTLSYRDGHLVLGTFSPIPHSIDARFDYTPDKFTLDQATLRSGPSEFVLSGNVQDFASPRLHATYRATIDSGEFRRIMNEPTLPVGIIHLAGNVEYVSRANEPMLQTTALEGTLDAPSLRVQTPQFRGDIRNFAARYVLNNGNLDVTNIRAYLLGGEMTGALQMRNVAGNTQSHLTARLQGVSVAQLKSVANAPQLQQTALTGAVNGTVDATWGKTFNNLVARTDLTVQGSVTPPNATQVANAPANTASANIPAPNAPANAGKAMPVSGAIHATYNARGQQLSLNNSFLNLPGAKVNLNGTLSNRSALHINVRDVNLQQLESIAGMISAPKPGQSPAALGLSGTASFNGTVTGSTSAPRLAGQLQVANLTVHDAAFKTVTATVNASPSGVAVQNGQLVPATGGRIAFSASAGLNKWSFTKASPFQLSLNASQVQVVSLAKAAGIQAPATGTLNANVQAHGSELNPIGQGTLQLTNATVQGQPIQAANVTFQADGNAVHAKLAVRTPAGTAQGVVTYNPKDEGYDFRLVADGIRLGQLQMLQARGVPIKGQLNLEAQGRGTVANPELTASIRAPQLSLNGQVVSNLALNATVANHVANVALDSNVVNTTLRGRATVNLTGDYMTVASLDTQAIPLAPLVAAYAPSQAGDISGNTEIHASLRGPLKDMRTLQAHVTIPQLQVNYKNTVQIGATAPIHADLANGVLNVQRAQLRGTDTDLQFQGTVPVVGNGPVSLLLLGTVNLQIAQLFVPDITTSGQLQFNINSYGQRSDPNVEGQVRIVNAGFTSGDAPLGLQNGNGVLTLTKDRLLISSFQGTVGGGTVEAHGGIAYRPGLHFDLALVGRQIRLLYPEGVRTGLNTRLTLTGTPQSAFLRGDVNVDRVSFTSAFDVASMMNQFGGVTTPPPAQGFTTNLQMDVNVRSTSGINLVSRTLSLQGAANLRVTGTAADPVILGRINMTGGDMLFNGNRYKLEGGAIDFTNPTRTQPNLNVNVTTTVQDFNISMRFEGPVDRLRTSYTSVPALPPADIINLLAFGQTMEAKQANAANSAATPGNLGAESAIASAVTGQITNRVEKIAGISHISIDPALGNSTQQNGGTTITVQQRVTSKIFVTFSTDVTSTQREVIQLEYQATPRFAITGTRDQNGGFGFETRIKKSW